MAQERVRWRAPAAGKRMVEWALAAAVMVVMILLFAREVRVVQGQSELAAVKATLGALRTALVLEHLQKNMASGNSAVALEQHNPFELLRQRPPNYRGEMSAAQALAAPPGSWVFDPLCVCIGYLPMEAEWFDSPSGELMAWYRVSGAPGLLQLVAKEAYVWQGELIN